MEALRRIQARITERRGPRWAAEPERLWFTEVDGDLFVDFFGSPFGESYAELMSLLGSTEAARRLRFLALRGPDEGANGVRNWDLVELVEAAPSFPRLATLEIERTKPADHNRTVVARSYDEEGVLGALLAKAPSLKHLTSPSAPDASFFAGPEHPLAVLKVDMGFDRQRFVENLAGASRFRALRFLEIGEYAESYMEDFASRCTPLPAYRALFRSPAFDPVRMFVWRNPVCTEEEIRSLARLRPGVSLQIVRATADYVRVPGAAG